jgi:hypothetical protein
VQDFFCIRQKSWPRQASIAHRFEDPYAYSSPVFRACEVVEREAVKLTRDALRLVKKALMKSWVPSFDPVSPMTQQLIWSATAVRQRSRFAVSFLTIMLRYILLGAGISENLRSMGDWLGCRTRKAGLSSWALVLELESSAMFSVKRNSPLSRFDRVPSVEAVSHPIINHGKNGNETAFGKALHSSQSKQMLDQALGARFKRCFECLRVVADILVASWR